MATGKELAQSLALDVKMLSEQLTKLEETLEDGCEKHIRSGGNIIYGLFFTADDGFCPIWASIDRDAVASLETTSYITKMHYGLVRVLGFKISEMDMLGFINGFDGLKNSGGDKQVYSLGQKFREKYIKVAEDESDMEESETGNES